MKNILYAIIVWLHYPCIGQLRPGIDTSKNSYREDSSAIYNICPQGAIPPNGKEFTFIEDYILPRINRGSIQYDLDHNRQGFLEIQFIIEKDGRVTNVEVLSSVGKQIDAEFVRIISLSIWEPAYLNDHPIRQRFLLETYIE